MLMREWEKRTSSISQNSKIKSKISLGNSSNGITMILFCFFGGKLVLWAAKYVIIYYAYVQGLYNAWSYYIVDDVLFAWYLLAMCGEPMMSVPSLSIVFTSSSILFSLSAVSIIIFLSNKVASCRCWIRYKEIRAQFRVECTITNKSSNVNARIFDQGTISKNENNKVMYNKKQTSMANMASQLHTDAKNLWAIGEFGSNTIKTLHNVRLLTSKCWTWFQMQT